MNDHVGKDRYRGLPGWPGTTPSSRSVGAPLEKGPLEEGRANDDTMDDLLDEVGVDLDAMLGIEPDEPEPKPPPGVRVDPRRHKVVCKHWLRGLCKKGDDCDFLHQLDRDRMPECWFFSNFGECNNKDCIFLHLRPEDKVSAALANACAMLGGRVGRTVPSSAGSCVSLRGARVRVSLARGSHA